MEPLSEIEANLQSSWLIKNLLPSDGLGVLYGPPGCCKSFVALDMGLHVAAGRSWAGRRVRQTGVIYIAGEGGTGFRNRIVAARERHDIAHDVPFFLVVTAPNLGTGTDDATALISCIKTQTSMRGCEIGLIIIDTLARAMSGADESSARDMGVFVANAGLIEKEIGVLVVAVHHTGKDADRGMRGSSALHGATAAEWEIGKADGARFLRVAKQKDGEDGLRFGFQVMPAKLGTDQDGEPVTTLVVSIGTEPIQTSPADLLKGYKAGVFKALQVAIEAVGRVPEVDAESKIGPQSYEGQRCVTRKEVLRFARTLKITSTDDEKSQRAMLNKRLKELTHEEMIASDGEWFWIPNLETSKQPETN